MLILVNSAGIEQFGKFAEITDEFWDRVMAVNLRGPFICVQEVLPDMLAAAWGRIVNISSSSAQGGQSHMAAYVSSKAGLIGFTKGFGAGTGTQGDHREHHSPGMAVTPDAGEGDRRRAFHRPHWTASPRSRPVRRAGRPEDIANAAMFLIADESSYVTGQVIGVNGGRRT